MRAPKWRLRNLLIFLAAVLALYLFVLGAFVMAEIDDGSFTRQDITRSVLAALVPVLLVVGVMVGVTWPANPRRQQVEDKSTVDDLPTAAVGRVFQFPARLRFQSSPTLYQAGEVIPPAIPLQPRRDDRRELAADEILARHERDVLWEDTGGYPPVPRWGEEAT